MAGSLLSPSAYPLIHSDVFKDLLPFLIFLLLFSSPPSRAITGLEHYQYGIHPKILWDLAQDLMGSTSTTYGDQLKMVWETPQHL